MHWLLCPGLLSCLFFAGVKGWLLTIDEYFEDIVQHIYNEVMEALAVSPDRRFIAVEQAYFQRWWTIATPEQQSSCKGFVANGQLEFIVGGWTMEDEACTTYSANIDQMTFGHLWLQETFGIVPQFGWQVDPFGASNVVHEHFAAMGFNATLIDRIDYFKTAEREASQTMRFVWETNPSRGPQAQIFTHLMDQNHYCTAVGGLSWSTGDAPVTPENINQLANSIVENLLQRQSWYPGSVILFPWGCDFAHFVATIDFSNMDLLIHYINQNTSKSGVAVRYATLGEYFAAVHQMSSEGPAQKEKNEKEEKKEPKEMEKAGTQVLNTSGPNLDAEATDTQPPVVWPTFTGDFLPYGHNPYQFWSGYFSSRSALKGLTRRSEAYQRLAEQVELRHSLKFGFDAESLAALRQIWETNGYTTHHDAVTGTSVPDVVAMYDTYLLAGNAAYQPSLLSQLSDLIELQLTTNLTQLQQFNQIGEVSFLVYNSLAWPVDAWVELPFYFESLNFTLTAEQNGNPEVVLSYDILPVSAYQQQPGPCLVQEAIEFLT